MKPASVILLVGLLVCLLVATVTGESIPTQMLTSDNLRVYRRSPTELWVYDMRPELGMGMHGMPNEQLDKVWALGILIIHDVTVNSLYPTVIKLKPSEE